MKNVPPAKKVKGAYFSLILATLCAAIFSVLVFNALTRLNSAIKMKIRSYLLSEELRLSSDQLTLMARAYVVTGNTKYLDFFNEILDIRNGKIPRPENYYYVYWDFRMPENGEAPGKLGKAEPFRDIVLDAGFSPAEISELNLAQTESDRLTLIEQKAFDLTDRAAGGGQDAAGAREQAIEIVYGQEYLNSKVVIMTHINNFIEMQEDRTQRTVNGAGTELRTTVIITFLSWALLVFFIFLNFSYKKKLDIVMIGKLEDEIGRREKVENELSRSLEDKTLLLRELNHRLKNTLQQIQSMLQLGSKQYPDNREMQVLIRESSTRILSIALVHQHLYKTRDLSRLSINKYFNDLCAMVFSSYEGLSDGIGYKLEVPNIQYLFDEAVPLGLVLNELLTNSIKYAFPGGEGSIRISLDRSEEGNTVFVYSDNGVGLPENINVEYPDSMGLNLVRSIGQDQLDGKIELKNDNGFMCKIEFKEGGYKERV